MAIGGSNKLIGIPELAAYLDMSPVTVREKWRTWGLKGMRIGKYTKFRERDIETWLETRERESA